MEGTEQLAVVQMQSNQTAEQWGHGVVGGWGGASEGMWRMEVVSIVEVKTTRGLWRRGRVRWWDPGSWHQLAARRPNQARWTVQSGPQPDWPAPRVSVQKRFVPLTNIVSDLWFMWRAGWSSCLTCLFLVLIWCWSISIKYQINFLSPLSLRGSRNGCDLMMTFNHLYKTRHITSSGQESQS